MALRSEELRQELAELPQAIQGAYSRLDRKRAYDLEQRRAALPGELSVAVAREKLEASESDLEPVMDFGLGSSMGGWRTESLIPVM